MINSSRGGSGAVAGGGAAVAGGGPHSSSREHSGISGDTPEANPAINAVGADVNVTRPCGDLGEEGHLPIKIAFSSIYGSSIKMKDETLKEHQQDLDEAFRNFKERFIVELSLNKSELVANVNVDIVARSVRYTSGQGSHCVDLTPYLQSTELQKQYQALGFVVDKIWGAPGSSYRSLMDSRETLKGLAPFFRSSPAEKRLPGRGPFWKTNLEETVKVVIAGYKTLLTTQTPALGQPAEQRKIKEALDRIHAGVATLNKFNIEIEKKSTAVNAMLQETDGDKAAYQQALNQVKWAKNELWGLDWLVLCSNLAFVDQQAIASADEAVQTQLAIEQANRVRTFIQTLVASKRTELENERSWFSSALAPEDEKAAYATEVGSVALSILPAHREREVLPTFCGGHHSLNIATKRESFEAAIVRAVLEREADKAPAKSFAEFFCPLHLKEMMRVANHITENELHAHMVGRLHVHVNNVQPPRGGDSVDDALRAMIDTLDYQEVASQAEPANQAQVDDDDDDATMSVITSSEPGEENRTHSPTWGETAHNAMVWVRGLGTGTWGP